MCNTVSILYKRKLLKLNNIIMQLIEKKNPSQQKMQGIYKIRLTTKANETECPRCQGVVTRNEKEECRECLICGYIDCGDDGA